ncbi:MAG: NADH-quinone oxidoreductase subunit G [Actinomycetales bacterium]|nr:NADH-quinone oxidoreductase subunit G [Actinomycetales bacterium]
MTATSTGASGVEVTMTIDDRELRVAPGTLVIRAAEQVGIQIPRFCDHPLLKPAGACRQCLVEVAVPDREGNLRPMPKPQTSCTTVVTPGMVVRTQHTSAVADKAQHGQIEFLLINHPLDCPTCDKGGECPLQNQAMSNGRATSRFVDVKRTFPKPLALTSQILLDRDRCILCQRCTRFSGEIAGDPFIDLQGRGGGEPAREVGTTHAQQIGTFDVDVLDFAGSDGQLPLWVGAHDDGSPVTRAGGADQHLARPIGESHLDVSGRPFASYFSGNTIQICPVGALTSASYRFRSRPFDLISTPAIAEHDANGSAIRVDHRRGVVVRRLAGDDPAVNEEWITDKDRFAFTWQSAADRLTEPLVRQTGADGGSHLRPASWSEALTVAAEGLRVARDRARVGVLPGGRLTLEDAYAYAKLARTALGTNDVDHRARPHSAEEQAFLAHAVAGRGLDVTFADLERSAVLLVGYEPEDEGGVVFLRLRKGVLAGSARVFSVAPFASRALARLEATLLTAVPGGEAELLDSLGAQHSTDGPNVLTAATEALAGGVVVVGERLATVPGALSAALRTAERLGARLAWLPRRIGERAGVEVGTLPSLLPGGRPVDDPAARADLATIWGVDPLPDGAGRDTSQILAAAAAGDLAGLLVGGLDPADLPDPTLARRALETAFVVSLEVRASEVTERADVVLPVAPPTERAGTYLNWEGRRRPFAQALTSTARPDHQVLDALAARLGVDLGVATTRQVHDEIDRLDPWPSRAGAPDVAPGAPPAPGPGQAVLATWHLLLDSARGQDGEAFLASTAHRAVARISPALAGRLGVTTGDPVTVGTTHGTITLPALTTLMPDAVVWLPLASPGSAVRATLRADAGDLVSIAAG